MQEVQFIYIYTIFYYYVEMKHPGPNEKGLEYTHRKVLINPRLCKMMWGPFKLMVLVTHPDTVKQIFRSSLPKGLRGFGTYKLLQAWLGESIYILYVVKITPNNSISSSTHYTRTCYRRSHFCCTRHYPMARTIDFNNLLLSFI